MMNPFDRRAARLPPNPEEESRRIIARWRKLVDEMPDEELDEELVKLLELIHHEI